MTQRTRNQKKSPIIIIHLYRSTHLVLLLQIIITADYVLVILDHSLAFRVTAPDAVHIQLNLLKMSIIMLETCSGL